MTSGIISAFFALAAFTGKNSASKNNAAGQWKSSDVLGTKLKTENTQDGIDGSVRFIARARPCGLAL